MLSLSNLCARRKPKEIDSLNIFYNPKWQLAWEGCAFEPSYDDEDTNGNDVICFACDEILLAKLMVFDYFFMPHPFQSRFHDIMLDKETTIYELTEKDKRRKRRTAIITTCVAVPLAILASKGGYEIGLRIGSK